jgi:hypothetical protein
MMNNQFSFSMEDFNPADATLYTKGARAVWDFHTVKEMMPNKVSAPVSVLISYVG